VDATGLELEDAAAIFLAARPRLLEIAYRIVGRTDEAEDVVQDSWLRWQATDRSVVLNPTAFLVTTTARLALNLVKSARSRHEMNTEPTLLDRADPTHGPEQQAERGDAVEHAVLLLLQLLSPAERASFVLREAFGYPYDQIARVVQLTPVNARQLVRRSHQRMGTERRRTVNPGVHRRLVHAFRAAADSGDVAVLETLLAADVAG
jgi:RNA polymerase sigma-70 factor (ECF subfamily)